MTTSSSSDRSTGSADQGRIDPSASLGAETFRRPIPDLTDVAGERSAWRRLADVWDFRWLLVDLVKRELRVRYKGSALGFAWTLLNPLLYLVVFSIVFRELLRVQVPRFGLFLLCGLLVWNFVAGSLNGAAGSIVNNRSVVLKVWFPREVLPLASVGAALVNLVLQGIVLAGGLLVLRNAPDWSRLPWLFAAVGVLVVLCAGLGILVAALNVAFRDVEHLLEVILLAWFWLSAIVYPYASVSDRLGEREWLAAANPALPSVVTFQRVVYHPPDTEILVQREAELAAFRAAGDPCVDAGTCALTPSVLGEIDDRWMATRLGFVGALGLASIGAGLTVFARREREFGEQL